MAATQILKILNTHIFGTNALRKAKLVSKHMLLWSSNPINMLVKIYEDFWLTKFKMATSYNWIRWQKYYQSILILAW